MIVNAYGEYFMPREHGNYDSNLYTYVQVEIPARKNARSVPCIILTIGWRDGLAKLTLCDHALLARTMNSGRLARRIYFTKSKAPMANSFMQKVKYSKIQLQRSLDSLIGILLVRYTVLWFLYECVLCSRANSISREQSNFNLSDVERRPKLKSYPLAERNQ